MSLNKFCGGAVAFWLAPSISGSRPGRGQVVSSCLNNARPRKIPGWIVLVREIFSVLTSGLIESKQLEVIFRKRVRVFHRGFKHEKTDESTRPQAECLYCFRVFETPMKHEARVFEITSPTKKISLNYHLIKVSQ